MAHEGQLNDELLAFIGIPVDYRKYLRIRDTIKTNDGSQEIVLIRTVPNYEALLQSDGVIPKESPLGISQRTPLDMFDSGIVVSISQDQESPNKYTIIGRTEDRPEVKVVQGALVEMTIDSMVKTDPTCELKEWIEGTILRVITVPTKNGSKQTLITTRTKLSAWGQWPNAPTSSETINACFREACKKQGISKESYEKVGYCFAFVLTSRWNTMKKHIDGVALTLFRVYSWLDGEYKEVPYTLPGAVVPKALTREEAVRIVLEGGVVMTTKPFENVKVMVPETDKEYSWLSSSDSTKMYFQLKDRDSERFLQICAPHLKEKVNKIVASLPVHKASTAEFIMMKLYEDLRKPKEERGKKQQTGRKGRHNVAGVQGIDHILKQLRTKYSEERSSAIERKVFDPRKRRPFFWGRTEQAQKAKQLQMINDILDGHEKTNMCLLLAIIKECATRRNAEAREMHKKLDNKNAELPDDTHRQIKEALENLERLQLEDQKLFLPIQIDDNSLTYTAGDEL